MVAARYSAAHAHVRISEAITGVSGELAELGMAVGRAEEKTERMRARATAIDALIESGSLSRGIGSTDSMEAELKTLATTDAVDNELAALMEAVQPRQLPGRGPGKESQS